VDQAYQAAAAAFETWGDTTPGERQLALFRIADEMEKRAEEFADLESQDTGKPRTTWSMTKSCSALTRFVSSRVLPETLKVEAPANT
jgi:acyl-CoA reductase-like NAD-dependent aldehyde dehydrogenase